jgi:hypothetical protein
MDGAPKFFRGGPPTQRSTAVFTTSGCIYMRSGGVRLRKSKSAAGLMVCLCQLGVRVHYVHVIKTNLPSRWIRIQGSNQFFYWFFSFFFLFFQSDLDCYCFWIGRQGYFNPFCMFPPARRLRLPEAVPATSPRRSLGYGIDETVNTVSPTCCIAYSRPLLRLNDLT